MADLSTFSNRWDRKKWECCAIIETPKNRRNKFDYDPESNLFKLGGLLSGGRENGLNAPLRLSSEALRRSRRRASS
jgi:hypothetical protein